MIQRIQTVFLLIAAIAQGLMFTLPFAGYFVGDTTYYFDAFGLIIEPDGVATNLIPIPFYIIISVICLLLLLQIAMFKKRDQQAKIGSVVFILTLLELIPLYYYALTSLDYIPLPAGVSGQMELGFGFGMPLISLFFIFLANKNIRKDEDLVKSVDRIR